MDAWKQETLFPNGAKGGPSRRPHVPPRAPRVVEAPPASFGKAKEADSLGPGCNEPMRALIKRETVAAAPPHGLCRGITNGDPILPRAKCNLYVDKDA